MILEVLTSLVIQTSNIKEANVSSINDPISSSIVPGESQFTALLRDQEEKRRIEEDQSKLVRQMGIRQRPVSTRKEVEAGSPRTTGDSQKAYPGGANTYSYGYCTWYVKEVRPDTPNGYGNAKDWPVNSQIPQVGAVIVTYEGWLGHVGHIAQVQGYQITIKEMNYAGWNRVSTRTVDYRTIPIKGFII